MSYKFETLALHVGQEETDPTGACATPIYATAAYVFKDSQTAANLFALTEPGNIYTRLMNPTNDVFEKRIAALEGGIAAISTASGMAAIVYAIQNIARAGDHIVSDKRIYGGTYNLFSNTLPDFGIEVTFVDGSNPANFEAAIRENTKAVFFETLGNPNSTVVDIDAIIELAHKHGVPAIVDNTFTPPCIFKPIEHGADIVVHSATKYIGGHGLAMGGVIIDSGKFDWDNGKFPGLSEPNPSYHGIVFSKACGEMAYITKLRTTIMRDTGACLSPFHSFIFIQGLETLSLRVERHIENTLKVVKYLNRHPMVERVNHPALVDHPDHALYNRYYPGGAGSVFTFEIKGGAEAAKKFSENLKLFLLLTNLADMKSLVVHPASTTHSQMSEEEQLNCGILPNTVRLSIGTEHIDDIIADLEQAFAQLNQ